MDATLEKQIKRGEKFYLDITTGFIHGATDVIENDERYKGRFIPWTAPIPPSGRVDMAAYQRKMAADMAAMSAGIAETVGAVVKPAEPQVTLGPVVGPVVGAKPETTGAAVPEGGAAGQDPSALSVGQRMDKIIAAMAEFKVADFTDKHIPKVSSLSKACGFDVEGAERDAAFAVFVKANPDWKPVDAKVEGEKE
jgi:hypothetical protein